MAQIEDRESSAQINDAAALWVARIEARPLSPEEDSALEAWLAADSRRQGAFARAWAASIHMAKAQALGRDFFTDPDQN
ncbi:DUF4880 domain-containing protein [Nitrospirillum viridazoti]|uniref:DUF4880 domain-containing protein n=1 Tax=Nitrospirillum viridazoti TaxID=3144925 RepID=UPI001300C710|nr:DUF4880 domain-containing protein [Nitrospirillum amazonense]